MDVISDYISLKILHIFNAFIISISSDMNSHIIYFISIKMLIFLI